MNWNFTLGILPIKTHPFDFCYFISYDKILIGWCQVNCIPLTDFLFVCVCVYAFDCIAISILIECRFHLLSWLFAIRPNRFVFPLEHILFAWKIYRNIRAMILFKYFAQEKKRMFIFFIGGRLWPVYFPLLLYHGYFPLNIQPNRS